MDPVENVLAHFGVKGMRWGVRRSKELHPDLVGIPKKTRKEAAKDAEEFTRAKLYFGEGAGTRRKLIKATVETKKKHDPHYAKAFDHFVKQTNLAERAAQARKQRKRTDRRTYTKKVARRVERNLLSAHVYQSDDRVIDSGKNFLVHFGIKGMKWGVRRKATVRPEEVFVRPSKFPGSTRMKVKGGRGHPATTEAVRARKLGQIGKKSGVQALSDQELQDYARRMQLEQNVQRLQFNQLNPGQRFVKNLVGQGQRSAEDQTTKAMTKNGKKAVGYAAKKAKRGAATAAIAVAL